MDSAERTAGQPEQRTCSKCDETKVVAPETWVYKKNRKGRYEVYGSVCKACNLKRQAAYDARREHIKAMAVAAPAETGADVKKEAKLDVARALKAGGRILNEFAPAVLARLLEYAEDPDHPMHQWALDKLVDRILPRKLYEELGGQAAGVGGLNDKRPVFNIQILPAQPSGESVHRIIDVTPTPVVLPPSQTVPSGASDESTQ